MKLIRSTLLYMRFLLLIKDIFKLNPHIDSSFVISKSIFFDLFSTIIFWAFNLVAEYIPIRIMRTMLNYYMLIAFVKVWATRTDEAFCYWVIYSVNKLYRKVTNPFNELFYCKAKLYLIKLLIYITHEVIRSNTELFEEIVNKTQDKEIFLDDEKDVIRLLVRGPIQKKILEESEIDIDILDCG